MVFLQRMKVIPAIGATCLGIVVGLLIRYFIRRFKRFTPQVFGSLLSIVLGGTTIRLLSGDQQIVWFYPIGLLLGFILYTLFDIWVARLPDVVRMSIDHFLGPF